MENGTPVCLWLGNAMTVIKAIIRKGLRRLVEGRSGGHCCGCVKWCRVSESDTVLDWCGSAPWQAKQLLAGGGDVQSCVLLFCSAGSSFLHLRSVYSGIKLCRNKGEIHILKLCPIMVVLEQILFFKTSIRTTLKKKIYLF